MTVKRILIVLVLLVGFLAAPLPFAHAAAVLELYGTFQAMGVTINLTASEDADRDAQATVEYRLSGSGSYRQGFPLTRVSGTRFVGSLFWLTPGTTYDVRVTFSDPDGGPLNGAVVSGSASTRAEIAIPTPSNSYYVSPLGSGTVCSLATPCALTQALSLAQPGDAVLLHGGVYYTGELSLPRSGTAGAPIVIQSYPGETAVFDGADPPASFTWTPQGGGVYVATVNAPDPHLVVANGQRLFPYTSLADLQNLVWGVPGFYASGVTVYVRLAGDADPNATTMRVAHYNTAFTVGQDFIYFVNLTFRHYGRGSYAKALYFNDGSDNLVQGSTFVLNDLGIGIKYDAHRNVIQDNVFSDTIFNWPWDGVKAEGQLETGGIRFYDPTTGRGTVIRRNTFHDFFDGFGACSNDTGGATNETDVYENLVYNTGDDGLETDGGCSNVRIWGNTFHDVLMGISLAPIQVGPVYAIRNVIYRTGAGNNGGVYSGSPFKFNSGYDGAGTMYLFHNTGDAALTNPRSNGLYVKAPGTWTLIYGRNNIWAGTEYAVENYNIGQPIDLDYDELWNNQYHELARWNNVKYATLAAFSAATGQEAHGRSVNPEFANAAGGDYTLASTSALIDAGLVIPGINDDYAGAAPDIGAFEVTPALALSGWPGNQAIYLNWQVNTTLPVTATWQIDYAGPTSGQITGLANPLRAYTLTGLTNYAWYDVTLRAMLDSAPILTNTVRVMPTDRIVYLPLVLKS